MFYKYYVLGTTTKASSVITVPSVVEDGVLLKRPLDNARLFGCMGKVWPFEIIYRSEMSVSQWTFSRLREQTFKLGYNNPFLPVLIGSLITGWRNGARW